MTTVHQAQLGSELRMLNKVDLVFALLGPGTRLWRETVKGPRWFKRGKVSS